MQSIGVNSFTTGMLFPYFNIIGAPQDLMHVEMEGLLKLHFAALLYMMIKHFGWMTRDQLNAAIRAYPWPIGTRLQEIQESSVTGTGHGLPRAEASLPFTAHQMMVVAIHSVSLLSRFVPAGDNGWDTDVWQCWMEHQSYFCKLLSTRWTLEDVRELDVAIYKQQTRFLGIPQYYDLWMPKHHYAQHFPLDILLWGPPIYYCCLMFEMENGVFKKAGSHCNRKNLLESCVQPVLIKRAMELRDGVHKLRLLPSGVERAVEDVVPGVSECIDLLWSSGFVRPTETSVHVIWLYSLRMRGRTFGIGNWVLVPTSAEQADPGQLAKVSDLFQIGDTFFLRLRLYTNALRRDTRTGMFFAFADDLAKVPADSRDSDYSNPSDHPVVDSLFTSEQLDLTLLHAQHVPASGSTGQGYSSFLQWGASEVVNRYV